MCRTFLFRLPQPEPRGGARLRTVAVVLRMAAGGVDRARSCGGAVRDAPFDAVADGASRRSIGVDGVVGDEKGKWRISHFGSQKSSGSERQRGGF